MGSYAQMDTHLIGLSKMQWHEDIPTHTFPLQPLLLIVSYDGDSQATELIFTWEDNKAKKKKNMNIDLITLVIVLHSNTEHVMNLKQI